MGLRLGAAGLLVATVAGVGSAATAATSPPLSDEVLPFIEDDYARALTEARARDVPIFVDSWAPW